MLNVTNTNKMTKKPTSENFMRLDQMQEFFQKLQFAAIQKKLYFSFKKNKDLEVILNILQKSHFIAGYTKNDLDEDFKIFLSFDMHGSCVIKEIKTVSKVSKRVIINTKDIKAYLNDYPYSIALVRTRNGIMNIKDCWESRIGGEFIAYLK